MLVGIQGSGKTTFANELKKELNCEIVSTDNVRKEGVPETEVWKVVYQKCADALNNNQDVIYDATNIRLQEASIGYTFPRKWFNNVMGASLSLTARNLLMIYCKAPFDPESTSSVTSNFYQGVDYFQQPSLRSLGFNVKLSF